MRWLLSNRIQLSISRGRLGSARRDLLTYEALGERVVGPDPDLMSSRRAELALGDRGADGGASADRATCSGSSSSRISTRTHGRLMMIGLRAEAEEADAARGTGDHDREAAAIARAGELEKQMHRARRHGAGGGAHTPFRRSAPT